MPATDPASLQEGLRRQQVAARELLSGGAERLGWKAGFGTAAAMEKLGTTGPLAGFLTDSTLAPSGSTFDVSDWAKPILEPEVAVRLTADVEAGAPRPEIEAAVGAVGAAIELVDLGEAGADAAEALAANLFHRIVLLGDLAPLDPGTSLSDLRIDVRAADEDYAIAADPALALGPLVDVLANMASLLAGSPDGLRQGDIVITGAAVKPFELSGGEAIEVQVRESVVEARIS
ncbi:MAG TPA: hypothetical protein VFI17_07830 [Solirubrobacterales bacterium]|nr:hypothetical protein [Solirubrobacterales bacterium]